MPTAIDAIGAASCATATAASTGQAANQTRAEQLAALNQMLYRYQVGISRGDHSDTLAALAMQIAAAEEALGTHLPIRKRQPRRPEPLTERRQTRASGKHLDATV